MTRTTIYLDVDGVLNAVSGRAPGKRFVGWEEYREVHVKGFRIHYAPALINALNKLAARDDVTFKWLTTWKHEAAGKLSAAIGLNGQDWEVLDGDLHAWGGGAWWKLTAIRNDLNGRSIWIDDDISAEPVATDWAGQRDELLLVSPSVGHGLTTQHLETITAYLDAEQEVAA